MAIEQMDLFQFTPFGDELAKFGRPRESIENIGARFPRERSTLNEDLFWNVDGFKRGSASSNFGTDVAVAIGSASSPATQ